MEGWAGSLELEGHSSMFMEQEEAGWVLEDCKGEQSFTGTALPPPPSLQVQYVLPPPLLTGTGSPWSGTCS